jgi:hypothetical protein
MDKESMIYINIEVLFRHKKCNSVIHDIYGTGDHCVKKNKPGSWTQCYTHVILALRILSLGRAAG